ncbi:DUF4123 domain-containing protein [Vibrio viridaestus]|uniref:DUF4123 domain-containing protein n=1 Tax=Vibrio viridaestus TaxID=2487322 RepID=A0A3N9TM51_9VIBR|nr:DUF4123 domain-containing protein [Vibrio viridaestus]RQW65084.1 DUF4123 domain-containing protein [Vibrio viridaestus]
MRSDVIKQYYLVLDRIRAEDAPKVCAQAGIEYQALYLGTAWQPQMDNSPIWIKISPEDAVWKKWSNDPLWASSGILFEFDETADEQNILASLKNNITVFSDDHRLLFFRFYSPRVLSMVLPNFNEGNIASLCGVANRISISPLLTQLYGFEHIENPSDEKKVNQLIITTELAEELLS